MPEVCQCPVVTNPSTHLPSSQVPYDDQSRSSWKPPKDKAKERRTGGMVAGSTVKEAEDSAYVLKLLIGTTTSDRCPTHRFRRRPVFICKHKVGNRQVYYQLYHDVLVWGYCIRLGLHYGVLCGVDCVDQVQLISNRSRRPFIHHIPFECRRQIINFTPKRDPRDLTPAARSCAQTMPTSH